MIFMLGEPGEDIFVILSETNLVLHPDYCGSVWCFHLVLGWPRFSPSKRPCSPSNMPPITCEFLVCYICPMNKIIVLVCLDEFSLFLSS